MDKEVFENSIHHLAPCDGAESCFYTVHRIRLSLQRCQTSSVVWYERGESRERRGKGEASVKELRASNFLPINTQLVLIFLPRREFQIRRNSILVDSRLLIELPFLRSSCLLDRVTGSSASTLGSRSVHKPGWLWSQEWDDWQESPTSQQERSQQQPLKLSTQLVMAGFVRVSLSCSSPCEPWFISLCIHKQSCKVHCAALQN